MHMYEWMIQWVLLYVFMLFSWLGHIILNDGMICDWSIGKEAEDSNMAYFTVLSQHWLEVETWIWNRSDNHQSATSCKNEWMHYICKCKRWARIYPSFALQPSRFVVLSGCANLTTCKCVRKSRSAYMPMCVKYMHGSYSLYFIMLLMGFLKYFNISAVII
jgi:hypothetical protein